jgi:HAD superfamily hydrolase (TIGR01484 family)
LIKRADEHVPFKKDAVAYAIREYVLKDNDISMLASDLDGTLLSNENLTIIPATQQAIRSIVEQKDIKFTICTGRGTDDCISIMRDIGFTKFHNLFIVSTNGSAIYDLEEDHYIFTSFIGNDDVKNIYNDILSIANDKHCIGQIGFQIFVKGDEHLNEAEPQPIY